MQKAYDLREIVDFLFPVGTVVSIATTTKPSYMQYGTWTEIASGRVLMGGSNPGSTINAGLPNITGEMENCFYGSTVTDTGAFKRVPKVNGGASSGSDKWGVISFDASLSNKIYGSSTTVQPPAYVVKFYRRTA